ncbi:GNAT family protein [uncultured Kordia sp.]|uniref:GNAT family N-acetyltransferase n=1 Tax=uncultured Kordia sp. TaxID=507699 RepID=UPI00260B75BA|nr:GNAT family protein [uncultured Kordia sp.]
MKATVREFIASDIEKIVAYFMDAEKDYLKGMGADKSKLPNREKWTQNLQSELAKPYKEKSNYYIIWLIDNTPVGHSNVNHISFGASANMHLHLWKSDTRKSGLGLEFLKMTIPLYFEKFELKKLICEPYAENIAPNKTLKKLGFDFIRTYETIPGMINFQQNVNRYELTKVHLDEIIKDL